MRVFLGLLLASSLAVAGINEIKGKINASHQTVISVADPVNSDDAATKNYVDATSTNAANKTLSNLTNPTSINQTLTPDLDSNQDIGIRAKAWNQLFVYSNYTTYNGVYEDRPNAVGSHQGGEFYSAAFNVTATNGGDFVFNSYDNGQGLTYGFNFSTLGGLKPIIFNTGTVNFTSSLNMNSHQINNVTDPTAAQDAATKNYVDTSAANTTLTNLKTPRTVTTTYTVDSISTDLFIFVDTSGGAFTITLPTPTNGRELFFKDIKGTFSTNNLTLNPGSAKIDTVSGTLILNQNLTSITLKSNGTDWFIL